MSLTLISSLLSFLLAAPLTLAESLQLPPGQAGDLALGGKPHAPITEVERLRPSGLMPPGMIDVDMREAPVAIDGGCIRKAWRVSFAHGPDAPAEAAAVRSSYAQSQIALATAAGCADASFTGVGGKLTAQAALTALRELERLKAGNGETSIHCEDRTQSRLCRGTAHVKRELAQLKPWLVTDQRGSVQIWLGTPGQVVTIITLPAANGGDVMVSRSIPAPA